MAVESCYHQTALIPKGHSGNSPFLYLKGRWGLQETAKKKGGGGGWDFL